MPVRPRLPAFGLIGIRMVIIGIRLQTWMRVILDVDVYGKIIARDLRLVASRLYRMAVTRPRVTCRRYIIPLFRRRPPGLHKPYKRPEKERNALNNHAAYVLVPTEKSRYRSVPFRVTFRRIRRMGKLHLPFTEIRRW
jgi:hypothetical protein